MCIVDQIKLEKTINSFANTTSGFSYKSLGVLTSSFGSQIRFSFLTFFTYPKSFSLQKASTLSFKLKKTYDVYKHNAKFSQYLLDKSMYL